MNQFINGHASHISREGDYRRIRTATSSYIFLTFLILLIPPTLELFWIDAPKMILKGCLTVDDVVTQQAPCSRDENFHPAIRVMDTRRIIFRKANIHAHVNDGHRVKIRESVEQHSARMIISAAEDEIAGTQQLSALGVTQPILVSNYSAGSTIPTWTRTASALCSILKGMQSKSSD